MSGRADGLHHDGLVLGSVTDDDAQFAAFATVDIDLGYHLPRVQIQGVGLRTIHDAQTASFLGNTLVVDDLCDVIHVTKFLLSYAATAGLPTRNSILFFSAHSLA